MPLYRIADVVAQMTPRFEETAGWYSPYLISEDTEPDFCIEATDEEIDFYVREGVDITPPISENMVLCNKFNYKLLKYFGSYIHSSALKFDDKVYLFSGTSGVGKSTLTTRICNLYPECTAVINDDKPSFRNIDGKCFIYGTPFAGGTSKQLNLSGELGAVVFLEQAEINELRRISASEAITLLLQQTSFRKHPKIRDRVLTMFSEIISKYPFYLLKCTDSDESAQVALEVIKQNNL